MTTVLVLGATGKTGRAVSRALAARGVSVRPGGRPDVDLESGRGLVAAMEGVDAVYHLAPNVHPDEVGIAERVVQAVVDTGVGRFVFHSVLHPADRTMPHHWRKHLAEQLTRQALPNATIIRPAAYQENLVPGALSGQLTVPYSVESPFSNVSLGDVGEAAAAGPGATLTVSARDDLIAMFAAYDSAGLSGESDDLEGLLGRPATRWASTLEPPTVIR